MAGLLTRGLSLLAQPSRFPSGKFGFKLSAYSCGGSPDIDKCKTRRIEFPFNPGGEPSQGDIEYHIEYHIY